MVGFEKKWHEVAAIKPSQYEEVFREKADLVIMATKDSYVDDTWGLSMYVRLLFQIINFKGSFDEDVFKKHQNLLNIAVGYEVSYPEAEKLSSQARRENRAIREFSENIIRLFRKIPSEIKEDIITFCLILGSENGRPIYKVREFLRNLYEGE